MLSNWVNKAAYDLLIGMFRFIKILDFRNQKMKST